VLSFWSKNNISWEVFHSVFRDELPEIPELFSLFSKSMESEEFLLSPVQLAL
jgi:hypothetical protein